MRGRYFLFYGLFVLGPFLHAQNGVLSGYVKDASTGESLIGATVQLVQDSAFVAGTTTNEYGYYTLEAAANTYQLRVSYLGFRDDVRELQLVPGLSFSVELAAASASLTEVLVAASGQAASAQTQMSVERLRAGDLSALPTILGEPDVLRTIQLLPGVSSVSDASSGFNVRGGSADQNLVLLDGATIYNASHAFGLYSVFNADALNDVTVYKGGIPARYGGRLSSVLDITQKEGNRNAYEIEGAVGLILSRLTVQGPLAQKDKEQAGRGSFLVAARRSYADVFTGFVDEFSDFKVNFSDLNAKANYQLSDKSRIFISGYFGRDNFNLPGLVGTSWGNLSGSLRYTTSFGERAFFQAGAVYSAYDYTLDNLRTGSELRWNSSIQNLSVAPKLSISLTPKLSLTTGLEATHYGFRPGRISPLLESPIQPRTFADKYAVEGAGFVELEQDLTPRLTARYGLRYARFWRFGGATFPQYANDRPLEFDAEQQRYLPGELLGTTEVNRGEVVASYGALEPRLSLNYKLASGTSVKASYNRMRQYLHLVSNTSSATPLDVWAPSGRYLTPQQADQVAVGVATRLPNPAYEFTAEAYYKSLTDVADFIDGADLLFSENIETQVVQGVGRAYGLEVQLKRSAGAWTGWVNYTLARAESKVPGINNGDYYYANNDQLHRLNLVGLYQINDRWSVSGNFVLGSGRPVTYPTSRYVQEGLVVADYPQRNGNRLPAYHRLDLSATLSPKPGSGKRWKWVFGAANLYNRFNAASIYFSEVSSVNDVEVATGNTQATRLSYFGIVPSISYHFKLL